MKTACEIPLKVRSYPRPCRAPPMRPEWSRMPVGLATGVNLKARMSASRRPFKVAVARLLAGYSPMGLGRLPYSPFRPAPDLGDRQLTGSQIVAALAEFGPHPF